MAVSLSKRVNLVSRAFYQRFDDYERGISYWIQDVYDDHLITYGSHDSRYWRVGYTIAENGDVTFDAAQDWQEVQQTWTPVEREAARLAAEAIKRALLGDATGDTVQQRQQPAGQQPAGVQHRDVRAEARFSSDDNRTTFMVMTEAIARDGMIVRADGLDTGAFMQNPVVLWDHGRDPVRGDLPVARCVSMERKRSSDPNQNGWLATIEWYDDEFSQNLKRAVKSGFVSMVSLGWQGRAELQNVGGRTVPVYETSEMVEFSIVGIGSDRNALVQQRSAEDLADVVRREMRAALAEVRTALANPQPTQRAQPAAAPSRSAPAATGAGAAQEVPVDEPTPNDPSAKVISRQATTDDYAWLLEQMAPRLDTLIDRKLGRA